jgi:hypothetical protein
MKLFGNCWTYVHKIWLKSDKKNAHFTWERAFRHLPVMQLVKNMSERKILRNYSLTQSWTWALLEKPPVVPLLKNFPAYYGTRRFITVFIRALHCSLSWARAIQSIPSRPTSLRSILIFSTHLRFSLPRGLFPSSSPTNILYAVLVAPIRATCPAHLTVFRNYYAEKNETHLIPLHQFPSPIKFTLTNWIIPMVTAVLTSALQN